MTVHTSRKLWSL